MSWNKHNRGRENSSFEEEAKAFSKSKKVIRSPGGQETSVTEEDKENAEMEEMKRMMKK